MSRKSRFLVGLTAAALTFGGLFATMGPEHFNGGRPMCSSHEHHCCMQEQHDRHCCDSKTDKTVDHAATDSVK